MGYADELQAVSVDEALIDVTSAVAARAAAPEEAGAEDPSDRELSVRKPRDPAVEVAEKIRDEVRGLTQGCEGESASTITLTLSQYWYSAQHPARQARYTSSKTCWRISRLSRRCRAITCAIDRGGSPVHRIFDPRQDRRQVWNFSLR